MALPTSLVRYRARSGTFTLLFLDFSYRKAIGAIIDRLDEKVGTRKKDFDVEEVAGHIKDVKLRDGIIHTLHYFYPFRTQELEEILPQESYKHLSSIGIRNPRDFRYRIFQKINRDMFGFVEIDKHKSVVEEIAEEFKVPVDKVELALWLDEDSEKVLSCEEKPDVTQVIGRYNYEMIETIIRKSYNVKVIMSGGRLGEIIKILAPFAKKLGLIYDIKVSNERVEINISGPKDFFGNKNDYGGRIAYWFHRMATAHEGGWTAEIKFVLYNKEQVTKIYSQTIAGFKDTKLKPYQDLFDSEVEMRFHNAFQYHNPRGWTALREDEPVIVGDTIFIPDFTLVKGDEKWLVEIVGFWTKDYIVKKLQKLREMQKAGLKNLILLVDDKYKGKFENSGYPVFYYKSKHSGYDIPYGAILNYIEKNEE